MFKKSPLKATKLHKRKRKIRILKFSSLVVVVLIIFVATVGLSRLSLFALTDVTVIGAVGIDADDIKVIAEKHLAGSYASLYAKSNRFIYPKDAIAAEIKATFPGISSLAIEAEKHALQITLDERKPAYIWCHGNPRTPFFNTCYFMDASGYIFSTGPQVSGNAYITFFGLITEEEPIGKTFLNQVQLEGFSYIRETLVKLDISMEAFVAQENGAFEIPLSQGGKIVFKDDEDPRDVASSIELLKTKTKLLNTESLKTLEYIDLRFGNKVYYKFIGDNAVQTSE